MTHMSSLFSTRGVSSLLLLCLLAVGRARADDQPQCENQPYVLVDGVVATNTNPGTYEIDFRWKKGETNKSSGAGLSATITNPNTSQQAAQAIRDALNGDDATNADWNFAVVQVKDEALAWVCIGTPKADDVSACGWKNNVGVTPTGANSITGLFNRCF